MALLHWLLALLVALSVGSGPGVALTEIDGHVRTTQSDDSDTTASARDQQLDGIGSGAPIGDSSEAHLLSSTQVDELLDDSLLASEAPDAPVAVRRRRAPQPHDDPLDGPVREALQQGRSGRQIEAVDDEPLDADPLDSAGEADDEPLDTPIVVVEDEPLDAPIVVTEEPLDTSIVLVEEEPLDAPLVEVVEPIEEPIGDEIIDRPVVVREPSDELVPGEDLTPVAVLPTAAPVAVESAAVDYEVSKEVSTAIVEPKATTPVRKKGGRTEPVVAIAGGGRLPERLADCDVAAVAGSGMVGVACEGARLLVGHEPAVHRSRGELPTVATAQESELVTSRRDSTRTESVQVAPTIGESIATAVQEVVSADEAVERVVQPAAVHGREAGTGQHSNPVAAWRSELELAATETGVPIEFLAAAIVVTSDGDQFAESPAGGVGLMGVPVDELVARGIDPDQWYDPAINIRVGAELLAAGAPATDFPAAVCARSGPCEAPRAEAVRQLIVHYRLTLTDGASRGAPQPDAEDDGRGWPFDARDDGTQRRDNVFPISSDIERAHETRRVNERFPVITGKDWTKPEDASIDISERWPGNVRDEREE